MAAAIEEWKKFISRALHKRLPAPKFAAFAGRLSEQQPIQPRHFAELLLRPTKESKNSVDPLIPLYVSVLLQSGDLIDVGAVLRSVGRWSSLRKLSSSEKTALSKDPLRWESSYISDEALLYGVAREVSTSGVRPKTRREGLDMLAAAVEWIKILGTGEHMTELGEGEERIHEALSVRLALGAILVAAVDNTKIVKYLTKGCPNDFLKEFSHSLAAFAITIPHTPHAIAEKLAAFQSQVLVPLEPIDPATQATRDEINQMIDSAFDLDSIPVIDLDLMHSRAGLYIFLQSMLVASPLTDTDTILNYLNNRYHNNTQSAFIDLILASFDVLANSIFRNEDTQTKFLLRSFLTNKLPLILATLSTQLFLPLTAEFCITQALSHVDSNIFPTFSSMFDESSSQADQDPFSSSVRQDFCFACCLHGMIPEDSIPILLGEVPMQTLPAAGRYVKEDLFNQLLVDPDQAETILQELEAMDGNVGAASQAICELLRHYCETKDTTSLKVLCSQIACKPSSMDVMLLFDKSTTILQPICKLLDGWSHDDDFGGEYQPVYEEFGSILLLVLAFVSRYGLSTLDLGITWDDSFVMKLLIRSGTSRTAEELTEQEQGYVDVWLKGLFNAEGGGLGDEPMSACPPQDFYLLMPTLMQNIVFASRQGFLADDVVKSALEFLVDTFLLPSIVGAIRWLASRLWCSRSEASAIVNILQILINPSSISSEASTMLSAILNIVARPLESSLRYLQSVEPSRHDIEPLSRILKPHSSNSRTSGADHTELESWTSSASGGMSTSIRTSVTQYILWSLNCTTLQNVMPPPNTYRQFLTALRLLGAARLLQPIIDEVTLQTNSGSGPLAIDVAVAFICALDPSSSQQDPSSQLDTLLTDPTAHLSQSHSLSSQNRLSLRDALCTAAEAAPRTYSSDIDTSSTIIRLYRRVEAQLAPPISIAMPDILVAADGTALDVDAATQSGLVGMDDALLDGGLMGLGMGGDAGMMVDSSGMGMGSGLEMVTGDHDDVFGDLM